MAKAANKGKFPRGKSGNPKGRPPETLAEVVALARGDTELALETLRKAMRSKGAPWAARIKAADTVLSRAWGEPTKPIKLEGDAGDSKLELRFVVAGPAAPAETPPKPKE